MNKLYIITGPAGVGKTTISNEIASKLDKSVLIDGDSIYNQFVGGRISPWKENAPLDLFWENCIMLMKNYINNGYDVVFNYIIKKDQFNKLKDLFKFQDAKFVVLLTDEEEIVKRDKLRDEDCQMGERSIILLNEFKECNFEDKYILDTTKLNIEETTKEILDNDRFLFTEKRMNKKQLVSEIENLGIPYDEFWILSTSALVIRDLYPSAGDLDIAVTSKGLELLKEKFNLEQKENGWYIVNDKVECVLDEKTDYKIEKYDKYQLESLKKYYNFLKDSTREKDIIKRKIVEQQLDLIDKNN